MSAPPPNGGFSLFPNTTAGPPRRTTPRPRITTSSGSNNEPLEAEGPHAISTDGPYAEPLSAQSGRQTPQQRVASPVLRQSPPSGRQTPQHRAKSPVNYQHHGQYAPEGQESSSPIQRPPPVADVPPRSETAFSQAQTLVRNSSTRSRSSIAKRPFPEDSPAGDQPVIRSMFPQYNPEVTLNQQDYFPTQTSPTHIPRAVISRAMYSPEPEQPVRSPPVRSPVVSPPMSGASASQWPPGPVRTHDPPVIPPTSSTEQLRSLWKVANGWKATSSEGRVYCLKMTQERDAPVYTLSSATQPFYNLRVDPTSVSAYVTLTRHDPTKPYKPPTTSTMSSASSILSGRLGHGGSRSPESKHWQEVLSTALEEEARRHRPHDGLVAQLYPSAASKMALEKPEDETAQMMAERECARLVWDDDSASHYLVHPALATPFCVTIERSPAWSRVEYTLEHHESPQHVAKLTRDGTGTGWLEIDTGIAGKIESFFIVDVAVTALMIVAASDEKNIGIVETFEPPPPPRAQTGRLSKTSKAGSEGRFSLTSKKGEAKKKGRRRMEELEMDLESQNSSFGKPELNKVKDKLPWPVRAVVAVVKGIFKCFIWTLTMFFRAILFVLRGMLKCLGCR